MASRPGASGTRQPAPKPSRSAATRDPMPQRTNRRIVLASRPEGAPQPENFRLEESAAPEPREGEVLLRTLWLSLDPYMRGRMSAARSYAKPVEIGEAMVGGTVNEVVESRLGDFKRGDVVL